MKLYTKERILTGFAFLFLLCMMVYRINYSSLWYDEWIELLFSRASILDGSLYSNVISTFQPPLYNVCLHFWLMIRQSAGWLRLFNIIPGMISGVALYRTVKRLSDTHFATIAVVLLAVSYQWVYMVQEAAEYCLMLMFVFLTVDAYTKAIEDYSLKHTLLLALSAGGAAYSQYGCVFIVAPILVLYLVKALRTKNRQSIRNVFIVYALSVVFMVIPLYVFFARVQLSNHEIGETVASTLPLGIWDFLCVQGQLLAYLILGKTTETSTLLGIVGVLYVGSLLYFSISGRNHARYDLYRVMLVAQIMHYVLVQKQIYAMVHVGMSAGFMCRYSVFYLALLPTVLVLLLKDICTFATKKAVIVVLCSVCITGMFSIRPILQNWHKSYDGEMAWTYLEWQGYEQTTVLFGTAQYAYDYFVRDRGYDTENAMYRAWQQVDTAELPEQFWLWYSNYGLDLSISFEEDYEELTSELSQMGYSCDMISDYGIMGSLAYYHK